MITRCSKRELAGGLGEYGDVGKGRFSVSPQGYPKLQKVTGFSLLSLSLSSTRLVKKLMLIMSTLGCCSW